MPEFYKRVVCNQFMLSDEDKARCVKGDTVFFEAQTVKHGGNGRFHILLPIGERLFPVYETQWIVRNPTLEIYHDHEFVTKFVRYENIDPVALQAKLEQVIQDRKQ